MEIVAMTGGIGKPPKNPAAFYINGSRLSSFANCEYDAYERYVANLVVGNRAFNAFDWGTSTHNILEYIEVEGWNESVFPLLLNRAEANHLDKTESEKVIKAIHDWYDWTLYTIPVYVERYKNETRARILATEQPVWLQIEYTTDIAGCTRTAIILGKLDRVLLKDDLIGHGQIKTVSTRFQLPDWLEQQTQSFHEASYNEALTYINHEQEFGISQKSVFGTEFDLLRKSVPPTPPKTQYTKKYGTVVKRSAKFLAEKNASYEEKLKDWASNNLLRKDVPFLKAKRRRILTDALPGIERARKIWSGAELPIKNRWACLTNNAGKPCTLWNTCYRNLEPSSYMVQRSPDYVDEATEAANA